MSTTGGFGVISGVHICREAGVRFVSPRRPEMRETQTFLLSLLPMVSIIDYTSGLCTP